MDAWTHQTHSCTSHMRTEYTRKCGESSEIKAEVHCHYPPVSIRHLSYRHRVKLLASKLTPSGGNYLSKFVDFLLIYLLYLLQSADGTWPVTSSRPSCVQWWRESHLQTRGVMSNRWLEPPDWKDGFKKTVAAPRSLTSGRKKQLKAFNFYFNPPPSHQLTPSVSTSTTCSTLLTDGHRCTRQVHVHLDRLSWEIIITRAVTVTADTVLLASLAENS